MVNEIRFRQGTAASATTHNPILRSGEPGYETDTGRLKVGDGVTAWDDLGYFTGGDIGILTSDDITDFDTAVAAATTNKADLVGGKVPAAQIPTIALAEFLGTVSNQAGMLALVGGGPGDYTIRTDTGTMWYLTGSPSTSPASWTELSGGSVAGVSTVNSRTGAVTLTSADVGLGNVTNTSDANKPVSTAQAAANAAVVASSLQRASNLSDLTNTATARTNIGLGLVTNTSDANKPISTATQTALNGKANLSHTQPATSVTYTPTAPQVATDVQAAIDELRATAGGTVSWPVPGTPSTFTPSAHTHPDTEISNSTTVGRNVIHAVDAQAARAAIGAGTGNGTSNLTLGTTSTTAAAGNHTHQAVGLGFTPAGAITATNIQQAIEQAAGSGAVSGSSSILVWKYASGAYPTLPVSIPAGVETVYAQGPTQPTTLPSWAGVAAGQATFFYDYAPLT